MGDPMRNAHRKTRAADPVHGHRPYTNDEGYDVRFIDAAFYDREDSCQPTSLAQVPLNGGTVVEAYASKDVPVLAYPILYCLGCGGQDHPCAYTHKVDATIGTCNITFVKDPDSYVPSERVPTIVQQHYTGRLERA